MGTDTTFDHRTGPTGQLARTLCILALTGAASVGVAGTAQARQDAGPPIPVQHVLKRPLERVGTQFVRGDDLTGNGVTAPLWVAEQ